MSKTKKQIMTDPILRKSHLHPEEKYPDEREQIEEQLQDWQHQQQEDERNES